MIHIKKLIEELAHYSNLGHEIIIIDDGSNDGSYKILLKYHFIKLYRFKVNKGKGRAIIKGLAEAKNDRLVIYDGDFELHPVDIKKLMILNRQTNVPFVIANRFYQHQKYSIYDIGNIFFTKFFNLIHQCEVSDALCCAKSFFKSDLEIKNLKSSKFDIDIEILSILINTYPKVKNVNINYTRRGRSHGKKLRLIDSFRILYRMIKTIKEKSIF